MRFISPEPNVDTAKFDDGVGLHCFNVYAYCGIILSYTKMIAENLLFLYLLALAH